jgi:hypothetical protein
VKKPLELLFIPASGVPCAVTDDWTLAKLQTLVGGYIEKIDLPDRKIVLVDEEGQLKGLPLNRTASALVGKPLVGPVVVGPRSILR